MGSRPRGGEYRNAAGALLIAFRMLFVNEIAARRAFRRALDGQGRARALLVLRTAPDRFGPLLPHVDGRTVELVDEAARTFARIRAASPRPLIREAADILRRGYVEDCKRVARANAADRHARAEEALRGMEERRAAYIRERARFASEVARIYAEDADVVIDRMVAYVTERAVVGQNGGLSRGFALLSSEDCHLFGQVRRRYRGLFGLRFTLTRKASEDLHELFWSKSYRFAWTVEGAPTEDGLRRARKQVEAYAAEVERFGPKPKHQPANRYDASRQAAPVLLDAMRLMAHNPADAAAQVRQQLVRMLPEDAEFFVTYAVRLAQDEANDERRRGGGRERSRSYDPTL
jgi:hypothetical protein